MKPGQKVPKVWRGKLRREERNPQRGELEEEVLGSCPGPGVRRQRGPACLKAQQNKLVSKPIWDTSAFKKYSVSWIVHSSNWSQTSQHRMTALTPSFLASPMNLRKVDAFAPESGVDLFNKSHQAARTVILSGKQGWEVQPWPLRRLTPPQLTNQIKNRGMRPKQADAEFLGLDSPENLVKIHSVSLSLSHLYLTQTQYLLMYIYLSIWVSIVDLLWQWICPK